MKTQTNSSTAPATGYRATPLHSDLVKDGPHDLLRHGRIVKTLPTYEEANVALHGADGNGWAIAPAASNAGHTQDSRRKFATTAELEDAGFNLTDKETAALHGISHGLSEAQFNAVHPRTRRSLFEKGLIKKDWLRKHSNPGAGIEYLKLTDAAVEALGLNEE